MTEALRALRYIQAGDETTPGTAVAATTVLRGRVTGLESGEKYYQPDEDRASLAANMADDFQVGVEAHFNWSGDVNFRDILWGMLMSIRGNITPTQPDASAQPNAYLWTVAPSFTAANTPNIANGIDTFTIEAGDNLQGYEVEYCFATRFEISGRPNEPCKFSVDITGRQRSDAAKTAALSAEDVQYAPFQLAEFYVDVAGASLGGSQKTGLLKGFSWVLETQFSARYCGDGQYYFTSLDEDKKKPVLTLTYARNSDSEAERAKYEARTTSFLQIKLNGTTEIDASQSNTPYLEIDQAVRYMSWPGYGEDRGLSTVEVTAEGVYDSTWGKMFELALLTDLSALP